MATQTPAQDAREASAQPIDKLLQVRTGKLRPVFGLKTPSGIFKTVHQNPVKVEFLGCEGDEHGYIGHGGVDKALMWYPSQHYAFWKTELPQNRLGKNSLISGIDRNRCQNCKVLIVSIVLSILSQYLPYF
jgi:MOSC domain-containing protein YiiM